MSQKPYILIHKKTRKSFLLKRLDDEYHTPFGVLSEEELNSGKSVLVSNRNEKFAFFQARYVDIYEHFTRGPQSIAPKDIGTIIAKIGLTRDDVVLDAGGGTGALCFALGQLCKEVHVYERHPEHFDVLQKNKALLDAQNVHLYHASVYDGIDQKNLDAVTLDLPEPWKAIEHVQHALKPGGFLVVYLPNLPQLQQFKDSLPSCFMRVETIEILERSWIVDKKIMRPEFKMLGHTGFLSFFRYTG